MGSWYVAPALDALRAEVDARWPGRDRSSDGAIGDPSHQARKSDHNPDWSAGGVVRARDFDIDGIDVGALTGALLADDRTRYVIYNRQIATRVPGGFRWAPYVGVNPHTGHLHVSVRAGKSYENDTSPWDLTTPPVVVQPDPTPPPPPEETDDMGFYFYCDPAKSYGFFNQSRGKVRLIPKEEWDFLTAVKRGAVPTVPVTPLHRVSQQWFDRAVALGTY